MKLRRCIWFAGLALSLTFGIEWFLMSLVFSLSGIFLVHFIHDRRRTHMAVRPYLKHQISYGLTVLRLRRKKQKEEKEKHETRN